VDAVVGGKQEIVGGFEGRKDFLATVAGGDVFFEAGHFFRDEQALMVSGEDFRIGARGVLR
jgi:hypothetical protein